MAWTDKEFRRVEAWRALTPPMEFAEIGRRLGGRSGEAVRQKVISERSHAARGGKRGRTDWRESEIVGPRLGEAVFVARLMAGGGHSRFTDLVRNPESHAAYWALRLPLIGPDDLPRPCGRAECQCIATLEERKCPQ